jgi:hypothetical protein
VFILDVFLSAETTMHCKVTCILYKKHAKIYFIYKVAGEKSRRAM